MFHLVEAGALPKVWRPKQHSSALKNHQILSRFFDTLNSIPGFLSPYRSRFELRLFGMCDRVVDGLDYRKKFWHNFGARVNRVWTLTRLHPISLLIKPCLKRAFLFRGAFGQFAILLYILFRRCCPFVKSC